MAIVKEKQKHLNIHYKKIGYYLGKIIYEIFFVDNFILSTKSSCR